MIYDRADASISEADIAEFDFDKIFEGVHWFHTTGITPALSDKAAQHLTLKRLLKLPKQKVSQPALTLTIAKNCGVRKKAREVMTRFWSICRCLPLVNTPATRKSETLLGFKTTHQNNLNNERYQDIFRQMKEKYNFKYIASTLRNSISASENELSAVVYDGNEFHTTQKHRVQIIVGIGGGDSFTSGLIYGLITGMKMSDAAEFGVAASAIKHTIPGDLNHATLSEVQELVKGDGSGRVQR